MPVQTRDRILDAFLDLAHDANAVSVSMPAVADAAGMSVRTVYRYFPTKDDLQTAAAYRLADSALGTGIIETIDTSNFEQVLVRLWSHFATRMPAVHAEHTSPAGRALRVERLPGARRRASDALAHRVDDATIDLLVAMTSSSMFLELVDRMGHSPTQAAAMAARAVQAVIAASQQEP